MPDWKSPEEIALDSLIFARLIHAVLGVYAWEYVVSFIFDWDHITGRKRFRWPMIFYFLNRYLLLFALVGITISLDTTKRVNCQALYTFNQLAGNAAVGLASINLCLRTIAVWANARAVVIGLIVLILGHWSLILQGILLKAEWSENTHTCVITSTNTTILAATFIYSMSFDLVVLLLNVYKLVPGNKDASGAMSTSQLGRLLFTDGLVYFIIAFLSNLVATVFMLLNLNAVTSIIFNVPAAVFTTIVACRVVRRLAKFTHRGPEVFSANGSHSSGTMPQFKNVLSVPVRNHTRSTSSPSQNDAMRSDGTSLGVHIQMQTFSRTDDFTHLQDSIAEDERKEKSMDSTDGDLGAQYETTL